MKSTSGLRHCLVAMLLAVSLSQTAIAAPVGRSTPPAQTRIGSTADGMQPIRQLPARIKRFLIWFYDELEIPKP